MLDRRIAEVGMFSNDCNVEADTMCSGREFQVWAADGRTDTDRTDTSGTTGGRHHGC